VSRFEDLLTTQLPFMRLAYKPRCMDNGACRRSFDYWKALQQKRNPAFDAPPYRLGDVPDTDSIWSLREAYVLYRDRELAIDMDYWGYDDSIHRYGWYEQEREGLHARLQQRASLIALFAIQLGFGQDVYEDDEIGTAFHWRLGKDALSYRVFEWTQRKDVYNATAPFFGRAFRPVMEAFKLHLRGERESVLYPCGTGIEASEVNRLVAEHLGVLRYNCLAGKSNRQGQRCEVMLGAYSEGERLQVASYLMAQQRPPIPVRLLLCELALRKVIPQGTYDIQV
jgi:hypothetical protein